MDNPHQSIRQSERRNFGVFVGNQIFVRIGWIFKTETIVMPGFLDTLTASGTVRGLLPLISRVCQSIPQFLIAHRLMQMPKKQSVFVLSAFGFALPWLLLSLLLRWTSWSGPMMAGVFLAIYAAHWLTCGCNMLVQGTLQGKLIRAERRGALLAYTNTIGCGLAVVAVLALMPRWMMEGQTQYSWVFAATGGFFALAAVVGLAFHEPPDTHEDAQEPLLRYIRSGFLLLRHDANFRRLAAVVLLYTVVMLLFPHYTVFGKRQLGIVSRNFIVLLVAQNTVNALASLVLGNIADRYGNRIVLRVLIFTASCVPLIALGIGQLAFGARIYWIVYAFLGFTPVLGRITVNYTLEISPADRHPQYLGVLSLLQATPLFGSPLLGFLIDQFSFGPIFVAGSILIFLAGLFTFRLAEPRHKPQE